MPVTADPQQAGPRYYNPHLGDVDEFLIKYKAMVYNLAFKNRLKTRINVDIDDLVQEGYIGLLKAYSDFDPSKGEFSSIAIPKIRGQIMRYIRDRAQAIRPPRTIYALAGSIIKNKKQDLSPEELAEEFGCSINSASKALKQIFSATPVSLSTPVTLSKNNKTELINVLPSAADFTSILVYDFVNKLDQREKIVLEMFLAGISQRVIAEHLKCSQMSVSRAYQRIQRRAATYFGIEVTP